MSEPLGTVLIVEDDPDIALIERVILERSGFVTVSAPSGPMALEIVGRERPDLVILDLMMPGMDGWSVLTQLTSSAGAPPVVVCSARGSQDDVVEALTKGARAFVAKPFDPRELVEAVRSALGLEPVEPSGPDRGALEPA